MGQDWCPTPQDPLAGSEVPRTPWRGLGVLVDGEPQSRGTHLAETVLGDSAACPAAAVGQGHPWCLWKPQGRLGCGWWLFLSGDWGQVALCASSPWGLLGGQWCCSLLQGLPVGRGWSRNNRAEQPQMWEKALVQPALP